MPNESNWREILARLGVGGINAARDRDFAALDLLPRETDMPTEREAAPDTLEAAWKRCSFPPTLFWLAEQVVQTEKDGCAIVQAACACARLAVPCGPPGDARLLTAIKQVEDWAGSGRYWWGPDFLESRKLRTLPEKIAATLEPLQATTWDDPETAKYNHPPDWPPGAVWDDLVGKIEPYVGKPLSVAHARAKAVSAAVAAVAAAVRSAEGVIFSATLAARKGRDALVFADYFYHSAELAMHAAEWAVMAVAYTTWSEGGNGDEALAEARRRCAALVRERVPCPTLASLEAAVARGETKRQEAKQPASPQEPKHTPPGLWQRLRATFR